MSDGKRAHKNKYKGGRGDEMEQLKRIRILYLSEGGKKEDGWRKTFGRRQTKEVKGEYEKSEHKQKQNI